MRIGYPCLNYSLKPLKMATFRLASYSDDRMEKAVSNNIQYVAKMLAFNVQHRLFFYRLSSDLVPFASHPICTFDWKNRFELGWKSLGRTAKQNGFRISMHPSQFVVLNGSEKVFENAVAELHYHVDVLELIELGSDAKIQIHGGGVYGDKATAIEMFISRYRNLPERIRTHLVLENDERSFSLQDCLSIHRGCGIPILFDSFHHEILNNGETWSEAIRLSAATWKAADGPLMLDYSSQQPDAKVGAHCASLDAVHFARFCQETVGQDFDVMLEIKDKENSALLARSISERYGYSF